MNFFLLTFTFILLLFAWRATKLEGMKKDRLIAILILFWSLLFFWTPTFLQYRNLNLAWADQGQLFAIVTNLFIKGNFYSYDWQMDHFNIHFTPFFYILSVILHYTYEHILTFISLHSLAESFAVLGLYKLSETILKDRGLALVPCFFFLLNRYTNTYNLYTHFEIFMVPFLFWFAHFALNKRLMPALMCLAFGLTVKTDFWIYGLACSFIFIGYIPKRDFSFYIATCVLYFGLILSLFYPWYYVGARDRFVDFWNYGTNKREVAWYFISHPWQMFKNIFVGSGEILNRTFWYIPFWAGLRIIPAWAVIALWRNSTMAKAANFDFYYSLAPIAMYSLCLPLGISTLRTLLQNLKQRDFFKTPFFRFLNQYAYPIIFVVVLVPLVSKFDWNLINRGINSRSQKILHLLNTNTTLRDPNYSITSSADLAAYISPRSENIPYYYQKQKFLDGIFIPDIVFYDLKGQDDGAITDNDKKMIHSFLEHSQTYKKIETQIDGLLFYVLEKKFAGKNIL